MTIWYVEKPQIKRKSATFERSWNDQLTEIDQLRLIIHDYSHLIKIRTFKVLPKKVV